MMIYVKEHPHQFMSHMQGQTKRIKEFYDDLAAIPRVKLINFRMDSFSLMSNAMAVATVLAYLYTFAQKSYTGYNYKGYKELTGYTHEESVDNIFNALKGVIFKEE